MDLVQTVHRPETSSGSVIPCRPCCGIGSCRPAVEFSVNGQVYDELMSMLATPEENAVAMLGLSGAIALDKAGIIVEDTGLFDILLAVAADEQV